MKASRSPHEDREGPVDGEEEVDANAKSPLRFDSADLLLRWDSEPVSETGSVPL